MTNEIEIIQKNTETIASQIKSLEVKNQDDYLFGLGLIEIAQTFLSKEIDARLDPVVTRCHDAWKEAKNLHNKAREPVLALIVEGKCKTTGWYLKEKQRIEQEKMKAQELAKKQAEDLAIQKAEHQEKMGEHVRAEATISKVNVQLPQMQTIVKTKGTHYREYTYAIPTSSDKPIRDILIAFKAGDMTLELTESILLPNESALNDMADALKTNFNIPGYLTSTKTIQVNRKVK